MKTSLRKRLAVSVVGIIAAAGALSACGAEKDSGANQAEGVSTDECVETASEEMAPYDTLPQDLPADYTPLSEAPKAGLQVAFIAYAGFRGSQVQAETAKVAAERLGWDVDVLQTEYTPEAFNATFEDAISRKPDAILLSTGDAFHIKDQLEEAAREGIIVSDLGTALEATEPVGLAHTLWSPDEYRKEGGTAANWVMRDSGCDATVAIFTFPSALFEAQGEGFEETLQDNCADCDVVANEYVELSDVGTPELTNKIVSTVQSNPSIDYIDISVGDLSIGVAAALKGAGLDDIKIIVHVPTDADFESLRKGDVDMLVHRSTVLATWMQIDGVARVLDSGKPVNGLPYPTTILTQDTVPESGGVEEIVFPEDYEDEFIGLWRTN